jgi:hypothetical protein
MYAHQITSRVADAHRQDLIAQARVRKITRASRAAAAEQRHHGAVAIAFRRVSRLALAR